MHLSTKIFSFLSAVALTAAFSTSAMAGDPIKIGVAGAHSGDLAPYGLSTVKAVELVVKHVNEKGGINGSKVELMIEDDICKPDVATNTATKLVSGGVHVVIGHSCTEATKAALPIYGEADVIVMSPSAPGPALTQSGDYPNFYRTIAPDDAQARTEVDFAVNILKAKKIAVIHDKGDYSKGFAEFAKQFIERGAIAEMVLYEGITPGAVDYSAIVKKIKRVRADVVIFSGYHPEASKIITQMRKKKIGTVFISDDGAKDDSFIKDAGKYAEGVYATGPADASSNPIAKQYREEHMKVYGSEPGEYFDNAVAAAIALTNAIEKAGSTDPEAIAQILHTQIALTPFGEIMFDEKGDAIGVGFSMYQVKNGKFVQVK